MRKLFFFVVLVTSISCSDDPTEIGSDFFTGGSLDISVIDSSTLSLSTFRFESLTTNNATRVVIGTNKDSMLGQVTASGFVQFSSPAITTLEDVSTSFLYGAIVLRYDEYSYFDTTQSMTINAHALAEKIVVSEEGALYNTDTFEILNDRLGTVTFYPKPHREDSVEVVLEQSFSQMLYEKLKNGDDALESTSEFLKLLKGVALVPDTTGSGALIGFSPSITLKLYYTDRTVVPSRKTYVSFTATTGTVFTHYDIQRSPYGLDDLSGGKALSSRASERVSFLQSGVGLGVRVDIPYLRDLKVNPNIYVTRAVLTIYPVKDSFNGKMPLPESLVGYQVDKNGNVYSSNTYTAALYEDIDLGRDTRYMLDVTTFVKEQMELQAFNNNALMFILSNDTFRASADRVQLASRSSEYATSLKIYYATINQ